MFWGDVNYFNNFLLLAEPKMIPRVLSELVEKQLGNVKRTNIKSVHEALSNIGVELDCEFSEFFIAYKITIYRGSHYRTELIDLVEPTPQIKRATDFVHEVWELPASFICFSTIEGEGGYLYDKYTGQVWDFTLATRQNFIDGKELPRWDSFFEFMIWYLT